MSGTNSTLNMHTLLDLNFQVGVAVGAGLTLMVFGFFWLVRPWVRAVFSGTHVPLLYVLGMRLRGTRIDLLIDGYVALQKAGEPVDLSTVEAVYLANRSSIRTEQDLVNRVREARGKLHEAGES